MNFNSDGNFDKTDEFINIFSEFFVHNQSILMMLNISEHSKQRLRFLITIINYCKNLHIFFCIFNKSVENLDHTNDWDDAKRSPWTAILTPLAYTDTTFSNFTQSRNKIIVKKLSAWWVVVMIHDPWSSTFPFNKSKRIVFFFAN